MLVELSRLPAGLYRRGVARQMSRPGVDLVVLDRYVLILLQEALRDGRPGFPSRQELLDTTDRVFGGWARVTGQPEEALRNLLLSVWNHEGPEGSNATPAAIPSMAAAVGMLTKGHAGVLTLRPLVASRNHDYLESQRREGGVSDDHVL